MTSNTQTSNTQNKFNYNIKKSTFCGNESSKKCIDYELEIISKAGAELRSDIFLCSNSKDEVLSF